jgi:hypothetical protein
MVGVSLAQRIPARLLVPQAWPMRVASFGAALCVYILLTNRLDFGESRPFQYVAAVVATIGLALFLRQTIQPQK